MTDVVLTEIDLDIENRLANHEFAIEWVKMQDERIKELEAALGDLRRAAAALKSD